MATAKGYEIRQLSRDDLDDLLLLQAKVLGSLNDQDWLRANSDEMLIECLSNPNHSVIGAIAEGELRAAAVLFDGRDTKENIRRYVSDDPVALGEAINLKLVLVSPADRGQGLGRSLVELLEQEAMARAKREILCTIHPKNRPSRSMFEGLGYRRVHSVDASYGRRDVYARTLPQHDKRWAR